MELKIKRLSDKAIMPIRAHKTDAGLDLTATSITTEANESGQLLLVYHTDIAVEIPEGFVGLLFSRSSISKKALRLTNAVGVIDAGYRGEITAKFQVVTDAMPSIYKEGERFLQLVIVPIPDITITEVSELSDSDRGANGYGSTGTDEIVSTDAQEPNTAEVSGESNNVI